MKGAGSCNLYRGLRIGKDFVAEADRAEEPKKLLTVPDLRSDCHIHSNCFAGRDGDGLPEAFVFLNEVVIAQK